MGELEVTQGRNLRQPLAEFVGEFLADGEALALHGNLDGRLRAETHHALDDVARLEADFHVRQLGAEDGAELFLQRLDAHGPALELHLQDAFLRPGVPLVNQVDGIGLRVDADEADGHRDVFGAGLTRDEFEKAEGDGLGLGELRAGRGAESELELAGVHLGEQLGAQARREEPERTGGKTEINEQHEPAGGEERAKERRVGVGERTRLACCRGGSPRLVLRLDGVGNDAAGRRIGQAGGLRSPVLRSAQQPHAQHRHQRAGEHEAGDHRETHGQRERREERLGCALHEERGDEHGEHAEHREETRGGGLDRGIEHGAAKWTAAREMSMDVLNRHGRLIHEDADGQRETAERHQIDVLPAHPQRERPGE